MQSKNGSDYYSTSESVLFTKFVHTNKEFYLRSPLLSKTFEIQIHKNKQNFKKTFLSSYMLADRSKEEKKGELEHCIDLGPDCSMFK